MSKINLKIIDKIKDLKCSSLEIDFLLYLARIANEFGSVNSLYYKETCLELHISIQSFYNLLDSLNSKKLINVAQFRTWGAWDVTINNNIYLSENDYKKKAYLNTNKYGAMLYSKEFRKLPVNLKYLILQLLKSQREETNFQISINKLLGYANIKSIYLLKSYMDILSKFFDLKLKNQVYYIKIKLEFSTAGPRSERDHYLIHKIRAYCKSYKIAYTLKDLKDLLTLFKQYSNKKLNKLLAALSDTCIRYHRIEPKLINSIVSK